MIRGLVGKEMLITGGLTISTWRSHAGVDNSTIVYVAPSHNHLPRNVDLQ
jgi:hypothetical protein